MRAGEWGGAGREWAVLPVVHQDRFDVWVAAEDADQLRAAVAAIADDSDPLHV